MTSICARYAACERGAALRSQAPARSRPGPGRDPYFFLTSSAVEVTALPAAWTSLPTPATVLQLATSRAEATAPSTISLRMEDSPRPRCADLAGGGLTVKLRSSARVSEWPGPRRSARL